MKMATLTMFRHYKFIFISKVSSAMKCNEDNLMFNAVSI